MLLLPSRFPSGYQPLLANYGDEFVPDFHRFPFSPDIFRPAPYTFYSVMLYFLFILALLQLLVNVASQLFSALTVTMQYAFLITFGDGILTCMSRDFGKKTASLTSH